MLYITQLIYLKEGEEDIFNEFESYVIPMIENYNGQLLARIRPESDAYIQANIEKPYEVHLIKFNSEDDFQDFMNNEERKKYLHLKDQAIRESFVIKGEKL